jgi:hypothetical protein
VRKLLGRILLVLLALELAGCATVAKMESGQQNIGERLVVTLEGPWNHVQVPALRPAQTWTMEGLPVDQLRVYAGIKDGEAIDSGGAGSSAKRIDFRASMQPDDIVGMFDGMLTRDGSTFKLDKLEPWSFGGEKGFRFEFTFTRKVDGVVNSGVGYGAVSKGELFALLYAAPRLGFFARHKDKVEQIARSARVKA